MTGYIAATVPARVIRVSNTTLFHIAMFEFGDPLQWVPIAEINGLVDPTITALQEILIPPTIRIEEPTGILEPVGPPTPALVPPPITALPSVLLAAPVSSPPPPIGGQYTTEDGSQSYTTEDGSATYTVE